MELVIDFECSDCHALHSLPFRDIAPGASRRCPECGGAVILTDTALKRFELNLHRFCSC